ncbi:uncharacterized protein ARMOST_16152 [Armillaria ostoyae]|uniref:Uncharacterized protein n=1 Tax=Armillaria ostoyae TaxID=47428 RepID=A0A284RVD9_ARMOS|nr:uncharacterized protein ARMOST_16152 [Armillaria ostoyae]
MSDFAAGSMTSRWKRGCLLLAFIDTSRHWTGLGMIARGDRVYPKAVGVDFWKQRLALTAEIMYHRQYSRDTRTRGSGGGGQGKEDDSRSPECETSPKLRAFSYILEDHFAWAWYGIQFTELFEIQHDGRGEAAENGADRVCEALLRKKKNVIGDGRRGCMFERKDRLLHDPTDEDVDDLDDEDDIKSVLGLPRYRYRHDRAIKIRGSAEDDDDLPSIDLPGEKPSEIGEWIVLDLLEDSGHLSLLRTLHRLFPQEHLSICEASTFVSSLLPSLDSSSTPIPLTPPPTALAFPEWPRKAGMGNNGGAIGCLMWDLAHTREEGSQREKEPTNDKDYEEDEEDDADYDQEQSDRMALEPSGVVTSIPLFASPATTPPLSSTSSSTGGLVHCM